MMCRRVVFREIISSIQDPFFPIYVKLALSHAITYPIITHIDGLGPFLFDGVVYDSRGGAIISGYGSWRLRMSELCKSHLNRASLLAIIKN